ncbi:MAG: alpha/beta hydrolase [Rhodococcus sp. (in: high G+C Gram-positive bacteria)]
MIVGFTSRFADLSDVRMHYLRDDDRIGSPKVVLLHGWPETSYAWRKIAPLLPEYDLIMPDLRGLGETSKPAAGYDKATIAADVAELVIKELACDEVFIVGHDWGGVVAFALATQLREQTRGLAVLDVTVPLPPGSAGGPDFSQGGKRWHHGFHRAEGLAEQLIVGNERTYYEWFFKTLGFRQDAFTNEDFDEYLRTYSDSAQTIAGLEYYRSLEADRAMGAEQLKQPKFPFPTLGLGGRESWGRGDEPVESLRAFATNVSGRAIPDCGHWIAEEQPEVLSNELRHFFETASTARTPEHAAS